MHSQKEWTPAREAPMWQESVWNSATTDTHWHQHSQGVHRQRLNSMDSDGLVLNSLGQLV